MTKKMTFNSWYNRIAREFNGEPHDFLSWDELKAYHSNRTGIATMLYRLKKLREEKGEKK